MVLQLAFGTSSASAAGTSSVAVINPSGSFAIKGGPSTKECSAFKASRDLSATVAQAITNVGGQIISTPDRVNTQKAMELTLTDFSWQCQNNKMTVKLKILASGVVPAGWKKSFEVSDSTQFKAAECFTISCASKKWEGIFYPMVERMAGKLALDAMGAFINESGGGDTAIASSSGSSFQVSAAEAPSANGTGKVENKKSKGSKLAKSSAKDYTGEECSYFTKPKVRPDGSGLNAYKEGSWASYGKNMYKCQNGHWANMGSKDAYDWQQYSAETQETKVPDPNNEAAYISATRAQGSIGKTNQSSSGTPVSAAFPSSSSGQLNYGNPSLDSVADVTPATCQANLSYLSPKLPNFTTPQLASLRNAILTEPISTVIGNAKQAGFNLSQATALVGEEIKEHERIAREGAACAAQTDGTGLYDTPESIMNAVRSGKLSTNITCEGIRNSCVCTAITSRWVVMSLRAQIQQISCWTRKGQGL